MEQRRILVVEDDPHIGRLLEELLSREGYIAALAKSGTQAVDMLKSELDLVLLDLMLPGLSGEELLPLLDGIPVIVLSAKAGVDSKVELLMAGACDYVTKPFNTKELLARIAVQLRCVGNRNSLSYGGMTLNRDTRCVQIGDSQAHLTPTEYGILHLLMRNPGQVVTKSQILDKIAFDTPDCTESSLKMHMSNLRRKLRDLGSGDCIEAVWGIGFKMG